MFWTGSSVPSELLPGLKRFSEETWVDDPKLCKHHESTTVRADHSKKHGQVAIVSEGFWGFESVSRLPNHTVPWTILKCLQGPALRISSAISMVTPHRTRRKAPHSAATNGTHEGSRH